MVPDCALGDFVATVYLGFLGGFLDLAVGFTTFAPITQRVDHSYVGIEIGQMHSSARSNSGLALIGDVGVYRSSGHMGQLELDLDVSVAPFSVV